MKIVHVIDYFQPELGYQETYLAREQKTLGHDVIVVTSNLKKFGNETIYTSPNLQPKLENNIRTIRLLSINFLGSSLVLFGLKKTLKSLKPDVVHCHNFTTLTAYLVSYYKANFRLVYDNHANVFNTNINRGYKAKLLTFFWKITAGRKISKRMDVLYAVANLEKDFAIKLLNKNSNSIPIIPLGADCNRFFHDQDSAKLIRNQYNIDDDSFVIVYAGKIEPYKKIHIMLNGLKRIKYSGEVVFLLVGKVSEPYFTELKKICSCMPTHIRCVFIKRVKHENLKSIYSASNLGIWIRETITIQEAMACGLPILISSWLNEAANPLYLANNNGVTFENDSETDLADKIDYLIQHKVELKSMSNNAVSMVKHLLNWKVITQKTIELYNYKSE